MSYAEGQETARETVAGGIRREQMRWLTSWWRRSFVLHPEWWSPSRRSIVVGLLAGGALPRYLISRRYVRGMPRGPGYLSQDLWLKSRIILLSSVLKLETALQSQLPGRIVFHLYTFGGSPNVAGDVYVPSDRVDVAVGPYLKLVHPGILG